MNKNYLQSFEHWENGGWIYSGHTLISTQTIGYSKILTFHVTSLSVNAGSKDFYLNMITQLCTSREKTTLLLMLCIVCLTMQTLIILCQQTWMIFYLPLCSQLHLMLLSSRQTGYDLDLFCFKLWKLPDSCLGLTSVDSLMYINKHLIIPRHGNIHETLILLVHDTLGHFGFKRSYGSLKDAYYWPNVWRDLEDMYIPLCTSCQWNKPPTHKPVGPLYPTPIPDGQFKNLAIDFIGLLPRDNRFNQIITITNMLGADYCLIPSRTKGMDKEFTLKFFDGWYCKHGLPDNIFSDHDKLFISQSWKALTHLMGVKLKMSTTYHPQTDGASERTNKTTNQAMCPRIN